MDSIDTSNAPSPSPIWDTVLRYGAYNGAIAIAISLLVYLMDMNVMTFSGMFLIYGSMLVVGFVMVYLAIKHQRDQLDGGIISYGKAFLIGLLVTIVATFISSIWNYVLINFIDTEYVARLQEQFVETWGESMPQEAMEETLKGFEEAGDMLTILKNAVVGGTIFGLIVGLITAAFTKRDPKPDFLR
jgi:Protein of unknown function (DUF4199)